jgi:glycosyltransferase involved in cell wall biosynthesis
VSRFVESIVARDLVDRTPDWRPHIRRIPDIAPSPTTVGAAVDPALLEKLPDRPFILFVGQLQRQKGIHVLLAAYGRLDDPPPLVLIGTVWPETPEQFPEGVTVIREAPHALVLAAWERALFGVAPSLWPDPLPGVVREAMSRGRPVVGSAIGGIVDMIEDGVTGLTVQPGSPEALAAGMTRLVGDEALRERLGTAAKEAVQEFTSDAVAAGFEELYLAATNEGARPS